MPLPQILAFLAAALAIVIFAGTFAVGRAGAAAGLDGFDQTALRYMTTALLVLPFSLGPARRILRRLGIWRCLALTAFNGATYSMVFLGGLTFAPAAYGAALVPGLQPMVVMLLALALTGERPAPPVLAGNLVAFTGLLVALFAGGTGGGAGGDPGLPAGVALFVGAAGLWGAYAFFVRRWQVSPGDALVLIGSFSALLYLPAYLLFCGTGLFAAGLRPVLLQMAYQGFLVGILAVFLYPYAIGVLGSTRVASMAPAIPLLGALIGAVFLAEEPGALQWVGLGLVTLGLFLGQARLRLARRLGGRTG